MFEPYFNAKNSPLRLQKVTNAPQIKSKSKVELEENLENKRCLAIYVQPKTVFEPYPNPKIAH